MREPVWHARGSEPRNNDVIIAASDTFWRGTIFRKGGVLEIKRTEIEDVVLVDGIWVELAYEGDAINVGGTWVNTPEYNPDDLDEVRNRISSNEEILFRLNQARAQRDDSRSRARKITWYKNTTTWYNENEKEVPEDGIVMEIAANGDEINVAGLWIGTARFNPNDLDEVRKIITSDLDIQLRLTQIRAHARAQK